MNRVPIIALALLGFATGQETAGRPNVLILLADDLGYSDLGCYGGEIRTPVLDSLAKNGLRFTRTYNSSRCCPSRASLLTGLYPHQAGIGRFVGGGKLPGYQGRLTDRCVTLAEVVEPAGYSSFACGKWHINDPPPTKRGFREFYGFVHGYAVDSWDPKMMIRLPEGREQKRDSEEAYFATNAITDHALEFLDTARKSGRPWLLYTAYQAPHFPLQAPTALSATYDRVYEKGWDVLRAERLERMKNLKLIPADLKLPPRGPIDDKNVAKAHGSLTDDGMNPSWESLPGDRRADLARRMAVYAAMVEGMDTNIGRIVESLRNNGELENTLILFLSDNGACAEWEPFGFDLDPADYRKNAPGFGINGFTPPKPNQLHTGGELADMGGPGSLFSYGSAWANLSNTPLSNYKHYADEGGIRTPMIVHWPARIRDSGGLRENVTHVMDIMATCVELTKADYPKEFKDRDILPMEGRSLLPAIGGDKSPRSPILFEHEGNVGLIDGDWKLVGKKAISRKGVDPTAKWRLYRLPDDPAEQHDLGSDQPERLARMIATLTQEAARTLVTPAP